MRPGSNSKRTTTLFETYLSALMLFLFVASIVLLNVLSLRAKSQALFTFLVFTASLLIYISSRSPRLQGLLKNRLLQFLRPERAPILAVVLFSIFFLIFFAVQRSVLLLSFLIKYTIISRAIVLLIFGFVLLSGIHYIIFLKHSNKGSFINCMAVVLSLLAISLQNVMIFRFHYFENVGFPWDFPMAYYAMTAFWTSTVTDAVIPNWVPFQQMGYPMALNLQTGINYPPFWTFPLLGMSYTLNRAVIFQAFHVLVGSVGFFFFLKASGLKPFFCLIGAIAFQFFGGFYSNSEHADIIRAFAIIPWLLFLFTFMIETPLTATRHPKIFFIPVGIMALASGGYPGNFIAAFMVLLVFSTSQLILNYFRNRNIRAVLRFGFLVVILTALGLLISFYHLGPAFFAREYLYRYNSISDLLPYTMGISFGHLPSLILTNVVTNGEPSMSSLYIGVPILLMSLFSTLKDVKRHFPVFVFGLFSLVMACGPSSPLWIFLRKAISLLGYSRFPSSDYRMYFCISLIFFGVMGFSNLTTNKFKTPSLWLRFVLGVALVAFLIVMVIKSPATGLFNRSIESSELSFAIVMMICVGILIFLVNIIENKTSSIFGLLFTFLVLVSGQTIVPTIVSWQAPNIMNYYDEVYNLDLISDIGNFAPESIVDNMPMRRPERQNISNMYAFTGYLSGEYFINDLTPNLLNSSHLVLTDKTFTEFMIRAWTPVLSRNSGIVDGNLITLPNDYLISNINAASTAYSEKTVKQTGYDLNTVSYNVNITEPLLMIENEIYYPGWTAVLTSSEFSKTISALEVNNNFRGWLLPKGTYQMVATFEFPSLKVYYSVSIFSIIIWIALTICAARRQTQIE